MYPAGFTFDDDFRAMTSDTVFKIHGLRRRRCSIVCRGRLAACSFGRGGTNRTIETERTALNRKIIEHIYVYICICMFLSTLKKGEVKRFIRVSYI